MPSANPFYPDLDLGAPLPSAVTGALAGATRAVLPGMFPPAPKPPKVLETQAAVETGKAKAAAAEQRNESTPAAAVQGQRTPDPFQPEWQGSPGFRWTAPATTTQAKKPTPYRGTHDPFAVRDPFGGGPVAGLAPEGMRTLFSAAGTAGQFEADTAAEADINARHRAALEAIALDEAMRPDPMEEALKRATANATFAQANVFAEDPFAERRFQTDEQIRAYKGIQGEVAKQKTSERQAFADEIVQRRQQADQKRREIAARPISEEEKKTLYDQLDDFLDKEIEAIGQKYGFAQKAQADPFEGLGVGFDARARR